MRTAASSQSPVVPLLAKVRKMSLRPLVSGLRQVVAAFRVTSSSTLSLAGVPHTLALTKRRLRMAVSSLRGQTVGDTKSC